ncbi:sulfatase-like hydrolase/transferase [Granulosicoccus sp. 3-233]|uniref:sulfatase-like hydrolase/transferase n=1 Tax=Granulosicoccus sp. 3-233 TaxID=3417969 RepID=UPI003D33EF2E
MPQRKPNLLFLFSDQHAQRVSGCYGDAVVRTPSLDRLASQGVTFDNCYCPSPVCVPSRMAALTACHPHRQECWTNDDYLASDRPTWLHALGAAGYRSQLIGRMHSMGPDQLHGYSQRLIGDHSPNWSGVKRHSMGVLENANDPTPESLRACGAGRSAYELKDEQVTVATIDALQEIAATPEESREAFSLTVGLMLPHAPYVASRDWVEYYLDTLPDVAMDAPPDAAEHPWIHWWRHNRGIDQTSLQQIRLARAAYWGLVSTMDEMIGRILQTLSDTGLDRNTLIVYASDHGDHLGERGLWWKHTFFDESVKVPLIMSMPGTLPAGERQSAVVNLTDLSQTMVDALGAAPLPQADGNSFWPLLTGASEQWDNRTFSEYCTDAVPAWTGGMAVQQRMMRDGDFKLHYYHGYPPLLFDLAADPDERVNLADRPEQQQRLTAMQKTLLADWKPDDIARTMRQRRQRKDILGRWAAVTEPGNTHLWPVKPEMNLLQENQPASRREP